MEELHQAQMLRGSLGAAEQLALLSSHDDLQQALEGAFFVQVHRPNNLAFCQRQSAVLGQPVVFPQENYLKRFVRRQNYLFSLQQKPSAFCVTESC